MGCQMRVQEHSCASVKVSGGDPGQAMQTCAAVFTYGKSAFHQVMYTLTVIY